MTLYKWSQIASADANADSTINWAEGQSPSSVNDSARGMMAATAKYRDDIAGAIVTGGTSTAYTVSSYEVFDTLARLNGQMIAFTPHATNGATVTLNVDSLGARPLRSAPGVELPAGTIIQGTPYVAVYDHASAAFYLRGYFGNPYNIPLGSGLPFFGPTAPNSSFVFPYGQAISRTTYSALFALFGATYGSGDGSTTFNVPDLRGRVVAGKDDMGGTSANRLTDADDGLNGDTLGDTGGGETQTLATANLPAYTPTGTVVNGSISHNAPASLTFASSGNDGPYSFPQGNSAASITQGASTFAGIAQGGTSTAFGVVQPTIIGNYILRII
ncbi:MAG: phage tail protein [Pseudomonadota bacterium]